MFNLVATFWEEVSIFLKQNRNAIFLLTIWSTFLWKAHFANDPTADNHLAVNAQGAIGH